GRRDARAEVDRDHLERGGCRRRRRGRCGPRRRRLALLTGARDEHQAGCHGDDSPASIVHRLPPSRFPGVARYAVGILRTWPGWIRSGFFTRSLLSSWISRQRFAFPRSFLAIFERLSPATTVYVRPAGAAGAAGAVDDEPLCTSEKSGFLSLGM